MAKGYSKQPIADEAAYQKKLEVTRAYFRPEMEVLEIGCGTGSTALVHAPHVKHIHAIDISPKMIEIARGKAEADPISNVTFECSTLEAYRAPEGSLDMVLALSILHLVENRKEVVARIHAMLKPGGLFVSNTVCLGDGMKYVGWFAPIGRFLGFMPYLEVFTAQNLHDEFIDCGFQIDHQWRPGSGEAVFIVAKKSD